jgi:hypothetical protein
VSLISRVDLLTLLQDTPRDIQADLGGLLGFELKTQTTEHIISFSGVTSQGVIISQQQTQEQPEYNLALWYVKHYQGREPVALEETPVQPPTTRERQLQPKTTALYSVAQLQVIWDGSLQHRLLWRGVDHSAAAKTLAQAKPIATLPRKKQQTNNQETLLFLDRSQHLTPIWQDQLDLAISLQKLLGYEQCRVLLMINGISGPMRQLWRSRAADWTLDQLPDAARLLFISDLGRYSNDSAEQPRWQDWLTRLKNLGHPVVVLTPLAQPDHRFSFQQHSLDSKASQFNKLQVAMCGSLQASLTRIRQLRQQVAGGCLEDELRLWGHPQRSQQPTGLDWRLDLQYLYHWHKLAQLNTDQRSRYQQLHDSWRASFPMETQGYEQMMDGALNPEYKQTDACLFAPMLDANQSNPGQHTIEHRCLVSQQALLAAVEQYAGGQPQYQRLYQATQTACQYSGNLSTETTDLNPTAQTLHIQQTGNSLQCSRYPQRSLLTTDHFIFDVNHDVYLKENACVSAESVHLRTRQADVELTTIIRPNWAQRFWQQHNAIYAAHCDNALFCLQSASHQYTNAQWQCLHNPWSWASDAGIDNDGLWADLTVDKAVYRLRWIVSGNFLMGSPQTEKDRNDDEQQHSVTLALGFWLGETSCTQAFWQAVMGSNPSHHQADPQLPVENISWHDCQQFLSRLLDRHPDFIARLPSEAQWEYASRAGTVSAYWWGDEFESDYANNGRATQPELSYPANAFGLKSISGNILEWCADLYGNYQANEETDPFGRQRGRNRVLRGGSWRSNGRNLRSARRNAFVPDGRRHDFGFRLAGGLDPQAGAQTGTANRGPWSDLGVAELGKHKTR